MQMILEWRDEWYTINDEINRQHLQIARLINRVACCYMECGEPDCHPPSLQALPALLNELYRVTHRHFCHEEQLMTEIDFPHQQEHTREHLLMLAELRHYSQRIEACAEQVTLQHLISLKGWFIDHVVASDKELALYHQESVELSVSPNHALNDRPEKLSDQL